MRDGYPPNAARVSADAKLKEARAIYEIGGRVLIDPPVFNLVALEVGSAAVREVSA